MSLDLAPWTQDSDAHGMEPLFAEIIRDNPFLSSAVNGPTEGSIDVGTVHQQPFCELVEAAEEVQRLRTHAGQVVWGEAGIGKSHLLTRLCRWGEEDGRAAVIFLHNIQPSPEYLPQYVLKCVVQRLLRGRAQGLHGTPLYWLVTTAIQQALREFPQAVAVGGCHGQLAAHAEETLAGKPPVAPSPGKPPVAPGAVAPGAREARAAYLQLVDRLVQENPSAGIDARTIYHVLFWFFLGAYREHYRDGNDWAARLAVRWLSGDVLEREEAEELSLRVSDDPENPATLPGKQAVESVLIALAELASLSGQPFILCFDQVDNLEAEQVRALTQFLHPLIDHGRNLLVIMSGVQSKLLQFVKEGVILRAAWERIALDERGIRLGRIPLDQARQILKARLDDFRTPLDGIPAARPPFQEDDLFPLGSGWFQSRTAELLDCRPRDVIHWARDRWRDQQRRIRDLGGSAWLAQWTAHDGPFAAGGNLPAELPADELARQIDDQTARKIGEEIVRRKMSPETLPADAANLAGLVEGLLRQCLRDDATYAIRRIERGRPEKAGRLPRYHLLLYGPERSGGSEFRLGLMFLATENRTSTAAALRRMVDDPQPPDRVFLICDQRQPLVFGEKGREYFDRLANRTPERFECLELSFDEYAELDALQAVIGDARSGDLEVDLPGGMARRVQESEAILSHHRQDRYRRHRLLGLLLAAMKE
ncbi:MAG: hypothetical protein ACLQNE_21285 [Thermoguttaceae bacterium]